MRLHYFNNRPTSRNASASRQYEATDLFRCFRLAGQSASLTAEPDLRLKTCTVFVEVFVATFFHFPPITSQKSAGSLNAG